MKKNKTKIFLTIIFLLLIVGSGIKVYIDYNKESNPIKEYEDAPEEIKVDETEKKHIEVEPKEYIKMSPDVDLQAERKNKNNYDIIGRLEIPDLFNILIVRGKDNQYYLNRSIEKKQDVRGSEFMDYRVYPSSKQINIYGHNSRDKNIKVPFLRLESFLDESFFNKNPYIIFQHDSGKNIYKIISIKEVVTDFEHMTVDTYGTDFVRHVDKLKSNSIYTRDVPYDENSEIIILQTCSHHLDNAYYIITAVKTDYNV